jgi:DNA-binding NarL/FixJ family response regulator
MGDLNMSVSMDVLQHARKGMLALEGIVLGVSSLFAWLPHPHQREVVAMMSQGLNNAGVARRLGITEKPVKNHINALYQELGLERLGEYQPRMIVVLSYMREHPMPQTGSWP